MNIDFYPPDRSVVPTQLRLRIDDKIDVFYNHLPDKFGYKFKFFKHQGVTVELASAITDNIVSKMIEQSYNKGAQWRESGEREIVNDGFDLSITVFFRLRDAG